MNKRRRMELRRPNPLAFQKTQFPKGADKIVQGFMTATSTQKMTECCRCAIDSCDTRTLSELATHLWRAKQRIVGTGKEGAVSLEMKKVLRPILSALDNLDKLGVKIVDYIGQPFVQGMALNVISSQPNASLASDRICETLKPTIFFNDKFVQAGDVIIEGPPSQPKTI